MKPSAEPSSLQNPVDVLTVYSRAIEAGDVHVASGCFCDVHDQPSQAGKHEAEEAVLCRKLDVALRQKFGKTQGDRLSHVCGLNEWTSLANLANARWRMLGDIAHVVYPPTRLGNIYAVLPLLSRNNGKWHVVLPEPANGFDNFGKATPYHSELLRRQHDVLDHLERYPNPGSVFYAISPDGMLDWDYTEASWQQGQTERLATLQKVRGELSTTQASDNEKAQQDVELSLAEQLVSKDRFDHPPASIYFVDGPDGGRYVTAHIHRRDAAAALLKSAIGNIDEHILLRSSDDLESAVDTGYGIANVQWSVAGNVATGTVSHPPPDNITARKIGTDWKIDLRDEAGGDVAAAATRVENEAAALERIQKQIESMTLTTAGEVEKAMREAHIAGLEKP